MRDAISAVCIERRCRWGLRRTLLLGVTGVCCRVNGEKKCSKFNTKWINLRYAKAGRVHGPALDENNSRYGVQLVNKREHQIFYI